VVKGKVVLTTVSKTESKVEQGIDVQFLVDTSGSMCGRPIQKVHEELLFLLFESGCVREHDFVSITAFNSDVDTLLPWTRRSALSPSMLKPLNASGGTQLWHAVHYVIAQRKAFQAAKDKKRMEEKRVPQSKKPFVLLVLTDGASAESKATAESVKARIATIGLNHEVAHFHMHVLGVGLDDTAERKLRDVCSASTKKCQITNIGAGVHATEAISDGFRKVFTKVINTVTKRTITASSGGVTVRDQVLTSSSDPSQASSFIRPALETHQPHQEQRHEGTSGLKVCPFGARCRHLLTGRHCAFKHDKGDIPCKWGGVCKGRSSGSCPFRH
jgi:Mg-chelatase subunit ChlD